MIYVLLLILFLSIFHFGYEAILAPYFRLKLRFKLFALRDKLIDYEVENNTGDERLILHVESVINNTIKMLPFINFFTLYESIRYLDKNNKHFLKVQKRFNDFEKNASSELKHIKYKAASLSIEAFLINSGGWFIYIIPFIGMVILYNYIKDKINNITQFPDQDIEDLLSVQRI